MQVRWTPAAADDLENIANYLFEKTPERAADLIREIYRTSLRLKEFPQRGREGKKKGTRELVIASLPYTLVYRVRSESVTILRLLHGSQEWPR
jgi:toxin ParE1/3/4